MHTDRRLAVSRRPLPLRALVLAGALAFSAVIAAAAPELAVRSHTPPALALAVVAPSLA